MEIRGKKCVICAHITGMMNETCEKCDSDNLIVFTETVGVGDRAFWGVTVAKPVDNSKQAWEFEEAVLGSTDRWSGYYDGHAVEATAVRGVGAEINLVEMHWYFEQNEGHEAVDLQDLMFNLRPGMMSDAVISVSFFDINEIEDDE